MNFQHKVTEFRLNLVTLHPNLKSKKKKSNVTSNSKNFARLCRYAVDRIAASRLSDVLQLYLHGYPLSYQRSDAGNPWMGLYCIRNNAGI